MITRARIAASAVVVGLWLVLAASAGAVPPPNPIATTIPIQSTTGPTCPTNQTAPPAWLDPEALDAYLLSPAQQVAGPGGSAVTTQTLSFGSPSFSISTPGCWAFLGDPQSEPTSPFELEMWKTSQSVEINGMYLVPVNSSTPPTLIVANNGTLFATGSDTHYDVEISSNGSPNGPLAVVGRVDLGQTPYHWDPVSGSLGSFGPSPNGPTFAGQPIRGGQITITNPNGICPQPSAQVVAQLPLPREFSTGPSTGLPPTGEADYSVSQPVQCGSSGGGGGGAGGFSAPSPACQCAGRVHAAESGDLASGNSQPIHLTVSDLYLGGLEVRDAFLNYEPSTDLWTGGGDLQLGDASIHAVPPPPNDGFGVHGNGDFAFGGAQYTFPGVGVPLFTGPPPVNLTEIGVTFALHPTVLSGDATLSVAGGEVTINGTVLVVFGDANEPYIYQPGALQGVSSLQIGSTPINSFAAGISGIVDLNSLPGVGSMQLGNGYVFYISPGYFEFAGTVSQSLFGVVQASGGVTGALDLHSGQYNLGGSLQVCANFPLVGQVCPGALTAVLSSTGFGACGQFLGITGGFTYAWGDSSPHIFGGPFVSCDLGPVTVVVHPASDVARARLARAGGQIGFDLSGGVPSTAVWVTGSGDPPLLTITGPRGQRLSNPDPGRGVESRDLVIWPEPKLDETLIEIRRPSAGEWTITPLTGSPAIAKVEYANGLPPAEISASVTGRGRALTLHYHVRPRTGQTVAFAERAGGVFHVIGRATGTQGSLRFTPVVGGSNRRELVAMISLAGVPRDNRVIAHYTVPAPQRPATPTRVRVLRAGTGLTVSWLPADRWGCLVVATLSDGRRVLYRMAPMRHSLRISRLAPGIGARITVSDLDQTGNASAAADASLAPSRPGPVTGVTAYRAGRRLTISWHRASGAARYFVTVTVRGRTPVTLLGLTGASRVTLIKAAHYLLASGAVARITVRGVNRAGQPGLAGSARYTPSGPGSDVPQPPPDRPRLGALDAIE